MNTDFGAASFERKKPVPEKLLSYGFDRCPQGFRYETDILEGSFHLSIVVPEAPSGKISLSVKDTDTGEEYLPLRMPLAQGSFVGTVRAACQEKLSGIAQDCFLSLPFSSEQANRLTEKIYALFGGQPDFPFSGEGTGVFRHPENGKWYAIVLHIAARKLGQQAPDGQMIDVMNVKIREEEGEKIRSQKGIYPAYHMNHQSWVTVRLDDTVPDEEVLALVRTSYHLTQKGKAGKGSSAGSQAHPAAWIIPSNLKYSDIISAYEKRDETTWRQYRGIEAGDTVYIYTGVPYKAILYRCKVEKAHIPDKESPCGQVMAMKIEKHYPPAWFTRAGALKTFGVTNVRGPRYMPRALEQYMEEKEKAARIS